MAVPKKKRSKARKRTHKSLWKINVPKLRPCPDCGELGLPHFVCKSCGYYKGKMIIQPKTKADVSTKDS